MNATYESSSRHLPSDIALIYGGCGFSSSDFMQLPRRRSSETEFICAASATSLGGSTRRWLRELLTDAEDPADQYTEPDHAGSLFMRHSSGASSGTSEIFPKTLVDAQIEFEEAYPRAVDRLRAAATASHDFPAIGAVVGGIVVLDGPEVPIGRGWTTHTPVLQKGFVDCRERERLLARLMASFEEDPLEDGMDHPAEDIIVEALGLENEQTVLGWLADSSADDDQPAFAAALLRCLGRLEGVGTDSWRADLIRDGLSTDDIEIRDAAVQAAESWGNPVLADVLRSHSEPEQWLQQYIFHVIGDLTG